MVAVVVIALLVAAVTVGAAFVIGVDAGASAVADKWLELHPEDAGVQLGDGRRRRCRLWPR